MAPDCDGNVCVRYQVTALAYAVAIAALNTPAYTEVGATVRPADPAQNAAPHSPLATRCCCVGASPEASCTKASS